MKVDAVGEEKAGIEEKVETDEGGGGNGTGGIGRGEAEIKKGMQVMCGKNFTAVADNRIRNHTIFRNKAYYNKIDQFDPLTQRNQKIKKDAVNRKREKKKKKKLSLER